MEIFKGIPASPGIAIGEAMVLGSEEAAITRRFIAADETATEYLRFQTAVDKVKADLYATQAIIRHDAQIAEIAPIFDAHVLMLSDKSLQTEISNRIHKNRFSAEYAVSRSFRKYEKAFSKTGDEYLMQRISDLHDIERRLIAALLGERREDLKSLDREVILVAHDLTPSQAALMDKKCTIGFITNVGGKTGHTAIVARAREIPAVVGLENITDDLSNGDTLIIDGNRGIVVVDPDEATLESYKEKISEFCHFEATLSSEKGLPNETTDGTRIKISSNIEFPSELETSAEYQGDGVGLYRTEFLYVGAKNTPDEEVHLAAYQQALKNLKGKELTIRTFDLGADKLFHLEQQSLKSLVLERNPALGCRAIRYTAKHPQLLREQVRAICRASAFGDVRVMLPMVCCREEVLQFRELVSEEQEKLDENRIQFNPQMKIGIMVEVPAVALSMENFLDVADFFSIGTNDLTQYTMAVDRGNESVADLYRPAHLGVLRLVKQAITVATENNHPISVCGEIAGDPSFTFLLLGFGLRSFSVCPALIPEIKKLIRSISITTAKEIADKAMTLRTSNEILTFLRDETRKICPAWTFA